MEYYRADKRDFYVGDVIQTANKFTSLNPDSSQIVERIFEENRPEKNPKRDGCLYLFDNLDHAKNIGKND